MLGGEKVCQSERTPGLSQSCCTNTNIYTVGSYWLWAEQLRKIPNCYIRIFNNTCFLCLFRTNQHFFQGYFQYFAIWASFLGCLDCVDTEILTIGPIGYLVHLESSLPVSEWLLVAIHNPVLKTTPDIWFKKMCNPVVSANHSIASCTTANRGSKCTGIIQLDLLISTKTTVLYQQWLLGLWGMYAGRSHPSSGQHPQTWSKPFPVRFQQLP